MATRPKRKVGRPIPTGVRHPRWKYGQVLNEKGYVRLKSQPDRGMYEHRALMRELLRHRRICASYVFPAGSIGRDGLPVGFSVNHFDQNKTHNCFGNLQLLQNCIHSAISRSRWKYIQSHMEEFIVWSQRQFESEVPF